MKEIGVALDDDQEYLGFRVKHKLKCLICGEGKWEMTVQVVKQQFDTLGSTGCPVCKIGHTANRNIKRRESFGIDVRLKEAGAKLVGDYQGFMHKQQIECLSCGHQWETRPSDIISGYQAKAKAGAERTHTCPACHERERKQNKKWIGYRRVKDQHELDGMDELLRYTEEVRVLTERNKRKFHLQLDPDRKRTMHNKGEYSIDHKLSVQSCFYAGISVDEAASLDNLHLMTRFDNNSKGTKLIWELVPPAFEQRVRDNQHKVDPVGYLQSELGKRGAVFTEFKLKRPRFSYSFVVNGVVVRVLNSRKEAMHLTNNTIQDSHRYFIECGYRFVPIVDTEIRENPNRVVEDLCLVLDLVC